MTTETNQTVGSSRPSLSFGAIFGLVLAAWFALVWVAGDMGLLQSASPSPFRPIAGFVVATIVIFFAAWSASHRFRAWVLSLDLVLLTALQGWRVIGFVFLPMLAFGHLPGFFAWPAGLGDVAVGLAAPFVAIRLAREPAFARSRKYLALHIAGLVDFVGALGSASLSAGAFPGLIPDGVTSSAMEGSPLVLFPSFIVPVFVLFHLAALMQVRALRHKANRSTAVNLQTEAGHPGIQPENSTLTR